MPICTHCGANNSDTVSFCNKCGAGIGQQIRAKSDAHRAKTGTMVRWIAWLVFLVVLFFIAPPIYALAGNAYYKNRLKSVNDGVMAGCGGPVTNETPEYSVKEIERCIGKSDALRQAQADYDNFKKAHKS